ncbi:ABC transporter [Novosphingobium sp.]|uniref:Gldg family protein n=1 Tax=Novosphingobium sp. TaxID=1874826 RepID=UPI0035B335D2
MWAESAEIGDLLGSKAPPHWAREALSRRGRIVPLDTLAGPGDHGPLAGLTRLVIAQPRPLSPSENVALDDWVRGGGRLLLIADPALTEDSAFAIGDPRRPQGTALLSPILARWGLELAFDDSQPFGETLHSAFGTRVPVNLAGQFRLTGKGACVLEAGGLAATCTIGKGRVVLLADAALLDQADPGGARRQALDALLETAFTRP